jgi:hypothetical protein
MPRYQRNTDEFYTDVKAGMTATDIKAKYHFSNRQQMMSFLADVMIQKNEILKIVGANSKITGIRKYGKMGIVVSGSLLENHFQQGDKFRTSISGSVISLTKI